MNIAACPHCKSAASSVPLGGGTWQVTCSTCHASSGLYLTESAAVEAWNSRAWPPETTALLTHLSDGDTESAGFFAALRAWRGAGCPGASAPAKETP